jgi:hypothetical protein
MIYIRVELWPGGNRAGARCLQEGIIHNTGGDHKTGEYNYLLSKVGGFKASDLQLCTADVKNVLRRGEIKGFPRLRLYAHDLLLRALTLAFGDRASWGSGTSEPEPEPACKTCDDTGLVHELGSYGPVVCRACRT